MHSNGCEYELKIFVALDVCSGFHFIFFSEIGGCSGDDLPAILHSRKLTPRRFRGSVVKYKCQPRFRMYGQSMVHCAGDKWSGGGNGEARMPICASKKGFFDNLFEISRQ